MRSHTSVVCSWIKQKDCAVCCTVCGVCVWCVCVCVLCVLWESVCVCVCLWERSEWVSVSVCVYVVCVSVREWVSECVGVCVWVWCVCVVCVCVSVCVCVCVCVRCEWVSEWCVCVCVCVTYRDGSVQRLPVQPQILLPDIQHVHLRAGHHDADQSPVFGSCSLNKGKHQQVMHAYWPTGGFY